MKQKRLILGAIIVLVIGFIGFRVFQQDMVVDFIRPMLLSLVTIYYCLSGYRKDSNFFYFLLFYTIGETLGLAYYIVPQWDFIYDLMYFGCNTLFIIAYAFLIIEILRSMNFSEIISRFSVHLVILLALDIYSIILVSNVAFKSEEITRLSEQIMEFSYNVVIMILLTAALINYLYRDSKKAMNLLVGALCIVFSEVIQVAYYYVSEINILSIIYSILMIIAFFFFYIQTTMSYEESEMIKQQSVNKIEA